MTRLLRFPRIMKPIQRRPRFAPEDYISHMPDNVVTNILDRLPLQDAVRTDVLSKTWRFKWNMLSQLVFDWDFFEYLSKTKAKNQQVGVILCRILLNLKGTVTKCVLQLDGKSKVEDEDIRHLISLLSIKGIKDLTLEIYNIGAHYKLPTHLFSCLELKHLTLSNCCFNLPPPNSHGFPNLLSLDLYFHFEESSVFWEFISSCPLLEFLKVDCDFISGKIKLAEIAKLENLKILYLYMDDLDTMNSLHSSSTTFELLGSLPKLQELKLSFIACKSMDGGAKLRFSTAFPSLKSLKLSYICLDDGTKLSCAFELIRSCPNLQTLKISAYDQYSGPPLLVDYNTTEQLQVRSVFVKVSAYDRHSGPSLLVDYNTTDQLQLRSVRFKYLNGSENEVCLLKYILACSPFLKKIVIRPRSLDAITSDEKLKFASKVLKLHQASPVVDIDLS